MTQIALVEIVEGGQDLAVFLNGRQLLSADPSCGDPTAPVVEVAESLAEIHGVQVTHISAHATEDEWNWSDIQEHLQASGQLIGESLRPIVVLQIAFTPGSFANLNEQLCEDDKPPLTVAQIHAGCEKAHATLAAGTFREVEQCFEFVLDVCEEYIAAEHESA